MRKLLLSILMIVSAIAASAQVPKASKPVCAYCGVDLTTGESHRSSCRYYKKEESSGESWAPNFNSIEYKYGNGVMCEQCGRTNGHDSDCLIGKTQGYIRDYWAKSKTPESNKFLIQTYEDNIRMFAKQGREARQAKKAEKNAEQALKRVKISYECNLCRASVMAYNINEAIQEFANKPWLHKPTCKNYKPRPGQNPSTKLKDYTPALERPMVSEPLIDMATCQTMPQFSSINESNIRYEKPMALTGKHEWGEIDEAATLAYLRKMNKGRPTAWMDLEYDVERYNHEGGPVAIGILQSNGRYLWFVFGRQPNGKYAPIDNAINLHTKMLNDGRGHDVKAQTVDVRYEGQGKCVIREWEGGYKHIYNTSGNIITAGYKVKLMNKTVDGKQLIYSEPDENGRYTIKDENGHDVASGNHIETYDDAIVQIDIINGAKLYSMVNWRGKELRIDGLKFFEDIKAYNNGGSYYLLKDKDKGYAVVGRGFRRVGDWYKTEEEAHRVWRASKQ